MEKYFIVNVGSESRKYALYQDGKRVFSAHFEKENSKLVVELTVGASEEKKEISRQEFENSAEYVVSELLSRKLIGDKNEISAIGFRVVAPGGYFLQNKIIDSEYLKKLETAKEQAPLHINPMLAELKALGQILPGIPIVGVSDSAFHGSMPARARLYGIPKNTAEELDIFRFGYHGISFESIVGKLKNLLGGLPAKIIICHLGGGSSVAAIKDGKSVDTSMGFTPLEGIVMANRVGDIDAGAITYLSRKLGYGPDEMDNYLNTQCGLLGLSGKSNDVRELLEMEKNGDENAKLALEVMVYKIKKYIGAYLAALNGADVLAFSGTIGERSAIMRSRICAELENLGIVLDDAKNNQTINADGFINKDESPVKIAIITTDEMGQMVKEVVVVLNG